MYFLRAPISSLIRLLTYLNSIKFFFILTALSTFFFTNFFSIYILSDAIFCDVIHNFIYENKNGFRFNPKNFYLNKEGRFVFFNFELFYILDWASKKGPGTDYSLEYVNGTSFLSVTSSLLNSMDVLSYMEYCNIRFSGYFCYLWYCLSMYIDSSFENILYSMEKQLTVENLCSRYEFTSILYS